MARRAAPDEKPYRPLLDTELVSAALSQGATNSPATTASHGTSAKILEMPRAEAFRRTEHPSEAVRPSQPELPSLTSDNDRSSAAGQVVVEKFDHEKRILFTRAEVQAIDRLVVALATRLNSQVKVSHVIRALVALLLNAEAEVDRRAGETGSLVRPANGNAQGLQRFEREIGKIIAAALRDAGPLR